MTLEGVMRRKDREITDLILMRHYHAEDFQFNTKMMKVTTVLRLNVSDMTGKRRNNIHKS